MKFPTELYIQRGSVVRSAAWLYRASGGFCARSRSPASAPAEEMDKVRWLNWKLTCARITILSVFPVPLHYDGSGAKVFLRESRA